MALKDELQGLLDRLESLRIEFEKYFIGVELKPPVLLRNNLQRDIRRFLGAGRILKTHEKILMDNLRTKFVSYGNYWDRTLREIDNGTYRRHIKMKAERKRLSAEFDAQHKKKSAPDASVGDGSFDLSAGLDSGVKKSRAYDSVYSQYKDAGVKVDYQKLEKMLEKQKAAIKSKYGAKDVNFSVKIVDGKPKITAKPVKGS